MDDMNIPRSGPAPGQPALPAGRPVGRRHFGSGARWLAGLAVGAVLAGGSVLGVSLIGGGSPQAAHAVLTGSKSGATGGATASGGSGSDATASAGSASLATGPFAGAGSRPRAAAHRVMARLRACVASARRLRASGDRPAARARLHSCLRRYLRLRAGLVRLWLLARRALHGQITVATKKGPRTIAFERGTVQSLSGSSVIVKAADGTAWTWQVGKATLVIKAGQRVGSSALAAGQRVFVIGQVRGGSDDARRVVIRG
jgi:hypothetical protein